MPIAWRFFARIDELRRVMQDEHQACRSRSLSRAEEMACWNVPFADPLVGQEAIRRLRRSPVLAGKGDAATDLLRKLVQQSAESLAVTNILKLATRHLAVELNSLPLPQAVSSKQFNRNHALPSCNPGCGTYRGS